MAKDIKVKAKTSGTTHIKRFFKEIQGDTLLEVFRPFVEQIAHTAATDVRQRLRRQLFQHSPLNSDYADWKAASGLNPATLVATKFYVNHIGVQEIQYARGMGYRVGVPEGLMHPDSDIDLSTLARIHEYGTATIPARPHYRPVWQQMMARIDDLRRAAARDYAHRLDVWVSRRRWGRAKVIL